MDNLQQKLYSVILPILAVTFGISFFFSQEPVGIFHVGISYFFLAFVLFIAGRKMFDGKLSWLANIFAIISLLFAICIWSDIVVSPNRFTDGIGNVLTGTMLFLSSRKKFTSAV